MKLEDLRKKLAQFRAPLLVLLAGLLILLLPGGLGKSEAPALEPGLRELLSRTEGVGEAEVLISEHGVIVVCEGAHDPAVKLDILRAVGSYTGFGSDRITILPMAED